MNFTRNAALAHVLVALTTIGVAVATTAAATPRGGTAAAPLVQAADANLIERFTISLDARCRVAVLRMRLSRSVPVGILVDGNGIVGRVPFGRVRGAAAQAAASSVGDVKIWDLTLSNGTELGPGRYRVVLRALSADRSDVLDVSESVAFRIPRSFANVPTRCGV